MGRTGLAQEGRQVTTTNQLTNQELTEPQPKIIEINCQSHHPICLLFVPSLTLLSAHPEIVCSGNWGNVVLPVGGWWGWEWGGQAWLLLETGGTVLGIAGGGRREEQGVGVITERLLGRCGRAHHPSPGAGNWGSSPHLGGAHHLGGEVGKL